MSNRMSHKAFITVAQFHPDVCQSNTACTDMPYFKLDGALHVRRSAEGFFVDWDCLETQLVIIGKKWYAFDTCELTIKEVA